MEIKQKKNKVESNNWKNIIQGFMSKMFEQIEDNISERIGKFIFKL
jgi:hypothetical protein